MARTIHWDTFRKALKAGRSNVVYNPNGDKAGAMVYLWLPRHPDSDRRGLWEIMSAPSRTRFERCPIQDVEIDGKWVRGASTFFKNCRKLRDPNGKMLFNWKKVLAVFPDAKTLFNSKAYKEMVRLKNMDQDAKDYEKTKGVFKPIEGNGQPIPA